MSNAPVKRASSRKVAPSDKKAGAAKNQAASGAGNVAPRRREQQRAIETRRAILDAALLEFAEKGYEAASIRNISERTGLQHPLITYHYRTKDLLWRAVAERAFEQIAEQWDMPGVRDDNLPALERLRAEYIGFLRFTLEHPSFHHFMLRESQPGNPRLPWLVDNILRPTLERLLPDIVAAQERDDLPKVDPVLVHYLMIGAMSVLSSLSAEIRQISGLSTDNQDVVDDYVRLVDAMLFRSLSR